MRLNRAQAADVLGCHVTGLDGKVRRGMPYEKKGGRGKEWVFESKEIIQWEKDQAVKNAVGDTTLADEDELKRRKLAAETTIAEVEAAKAKGLVADLEEIERQYSDLHVDFRTRMRQIPARAAPQLLGESSERAIKEVLLDEINEALTVLGNAAA